ncbi:MAG TPA: glycosyltransferase [Candidatus Saccharimonadales bacterium]|nr:glycosyltransferase [Candidatus Saccharimonadales bacterium]
MNPNRGANKLPKISVVIPAFNESAMLPFCLKAINQQDYKGDIEVIVVDNASTDETAEIAKSFNAKVQYEPRHGVVFARRAGFKAASGGIIASTDADTIVPKNWISLIELALRDKQYSGVVGAYKLCNVNSPSKRLAQILIPFFRTIDLLLGAHFAGANFAVYKKAYEGVGGFKTEFITGEDLDLSYRLRKSGYKLKVAYSIRVKTSARRLNEGLWDTLINYVIKNWVSLVFFHHPYLQKLSVVREEPSEIEETVGL